MATSRRSFLSDMVKACIGASILPAALTYYRKWKYDKTLFIPNPAFETAEYEMHFVLNPNWACKQDEITLGRFKEVVAEDYKNMFNSKAVFYKKNEQGFFCKVV